MSKETSRGAATDTHRGPSGIIPARLPAWREMVDELHAVCNAVEAGVPLERVATVRTFRIAATARTPSPDEIRAIRDSLGLSQAGFADFLGTGLTTVRSWELGQREPSSLARRLLGAIRDDPAYWHARLARMTRAEGPPPARRGG